MSDVTLILPAWRRPGYFRQSLRTWEAAGMRDLHRVTVALSPSPASSLMLNVLSEHDLSDVQWDSAEAMSVYGPHTAIGEAIQDAFSDPECGFVMVSDEDVTVSNDILSYVAWCREQGAEIVNCHNDLGQGWCPVWDDSNVDQAAVRMVHEFSGWTWGITRAVWDEHIGPTWDWKANSGPSPTEHGFDWQCHRVARDRKLRCAMPDASRCQNIGQYDGVYANPTQYESTVAKSFRAERPPHYILVA